MDTMKSPIMEGHILEQNLIKSEYDFLRLDIIDWNRCGSLINPGDALKAIASYLVNHANYTIVQTDLQAAPSRDDWPGWKHVGNHEYYGRLYWNWFHFYVGGELHFDDAPDFYGTIKRADKTVARFYGDIGKVSASAFFETEWNMHAGDLWISIIGEEKQVIIEPLIDIARISNELLAARLGPL